MSIIGEVKVTPDVLRRQADEVERLVKGVKLKFETIKGVLDKTKGHWIGTGGDVHRATYDNKKEDLERIFNRLLEHPTDLRTMAGVYDSAERNVVTNIQSLPTDAIS